MTPPIRPKDVDNVNFDFGCEARKGSPASGDDILWANWRSHSLQKVFHDLGQRIHQHANECARKRHEHRKNISPRTDGDPNVPVDKGLLINGLSSEIVSMPKSSYRIGALRVLAHRLGSRHHVRITKTTSTVVPNRNV
jgi:hypothetical protein